MANASTRNATVAAQKVIHINLNCSDVHRDRALFEALGLVALSHMQAEPQDGSGMGIHGTVQWNGYGMHGSAGWEGTMIDLLQWTQPATSGKPYPQPHQVGFARLGITVPNLEDALAAVTRHGATVLAPPAPGVDGKPGFCCRDGDGSVLEIVEGNGEAAVRFVVINCSDLERSQAWYATHLGFTAESEIATREIESTYFGSTGQACIRHLTMSIPNAPHPFAIHLQQWLTPATTGEPYAAAHHAGLYRMALAVDDARADYQALVKAGVNCPYPPAWLDMGPDIPIDGLWALFFRDPDGICVELIQNPELGL